MFFFLSLSGDHLYLPLLPHSFPPRRSSHLHRGCPDVPCLPPYDTGRLVAEAALLVDWYLPAMSGRETPAAQRESYLAAWREVVPAMLAVPHKLVLRDYHVDNLMVID